jgi:hypothetical protein
MVIEAEEGRPGLGRTNAFAGQPRLQDRDNVPGVPEEDPDGVAQACAEGRARRNREWQAVSVGQRTISRTRDVIIRDPRRRS